MAATLNLSEEEFTKKYTRAIGGRRSLNERETPHGFDCVFLDRETKAGVALCRIYKTRPSQCGTWPFWPDNLTSARAWKAAKARTPCPGMDNGPLIPSDQIGILRERDRVDNDSAPW